MIFNSVTYVLFLLGVLVLYWLLPRRARLTMIFVSSLAFYGFWRVEFLPVMLASAVTDYCAGIAIHRSKVPRVRKLWVLLSLIVNLGLLLYFKYLGFLVDNVSGLAGLLGLDIEIPALEIILPLGISFYTFQTISYTIDVYRGFIKPERDFILFGCYVTFFPQLVAGPILRAREVIQQLSDRPALDLTDLGVGLRRILYGLFLKVVLADNISPLVDDGFAQGIGVIGALDVWTLAFLFGFQIYFDFSAYSHIAIGSARVMGIRFPENFNFPYAATSPRDFWRRWHISLSSWIRDYLYLPLAGQRVHDRSTGGLATAASTEAEPAHFNRALFLTWAIMGLWHGANWTFVLWGLYHALFIFVYRSMLPLLRRLPTSLAQTGGWFVTLPLAMLSWIPFRAPDLTTTFLMFGKLFQPAEYLRMGMRENVYLVTGLLLVLMLITYHFQTRLQTILRRRTWAYVLAESVSLTFIVSLVFIFLRPIRQFIYFQF